MANAFEFKFTRLKPRNDQWTAATLAEPVTPLSSRTPEANTGQRQIVTSASVYRQPHTQWYLANQLAIANDEQAKNRELQDAWNKKLSEQLHTAFIQNVTGQNWLREKLTSLGSELKVGPEADFFSRVAADGTPLPSQIAGRTSFGSGWTPKPINSFQQGYQTTPGRLLNSFQSGYKFGYV